MHRHANLFVAGDSAGLEDEGEGPLVRFDAPIEHRGVKLDCFPGLVGVGAASYHGVAWYCVGVGGGVEDSVGGVRVVEGGECGWSLVAE